MAWRLIAVLVVVPVYLLVAGWADFQDLRTTEPVRTRTVAVGEPVAVRDATVTVRRTRITDSTTMDISGVDDATQQLLVVEVDLQVHRPMPDLTACTARLDADVDGVSAHHQARFSASKIACDGSKTGVQHSTFVFVVPRGEVRQASLFLQVGPDSPTWLLAEVA
ncbi:hypothetical protein [Enemella sp. A6]|uniref:hypothetical protein n=1 Tax=Enemella sp. A6 TaxID=3440152 RepID=UPI003EB9F517